MGKQQPDTKLSQKLSTAVVGPKELSGHSHEAGKVYTADDPRRFITNYQVKHFDMNPRGKDREGHVVGGVQSKQFFFAKKFKIIKFNFYYFSQISKT
jgi:protein phosphatase 1 regulatory subunit 32